MKKHSSIFFLSHSLNVLPKPFKNSLIIHFKTTNHMANNSKYFNAYVSCPSNKKIIITNGSLNNIASNGNIKLSLILFSQNPLHGSKLYTNLTKLSQYLNCKLIFFSSHYDFQKDNSRKMIRRVEARNGHYYLDAPRNFFTFLLLTLHTTFDFTTKNLATDFFYFLCYSRI